jgi:hypothetical protein
MVQPYHFCLGNNGIESNMLKSNTSDPSDTGFMYLDLSEKLAKQNIVESFDFNSHGYLVLRLNHEYERKTIPYQFDFNHYQKSLQSFEAKLENKGIGKEHATMLIDIVDNNYEQIIDFVKNYESKLEASGNHKPIQKAIRKYTANGMLPSHEYVVFVGIQQLPDDHRQEQPIQPSAFLYLDKDNRPRYVQEIETWNETFYPADTIHTQTLSPIFSNHQRSWSYTIL